jgi:hypothetical protein
VRRVFDYAQANSDVLPEAGVATLERTAVPSRADMGLLMQMPLTLKPQSRLMIVSPSDQIGTDRRTGPNGRQIS